MSSLILLGLPAAEHPRLLFGQDDIPALRKKIESGIHAKMFERLKADLEHDDWGRPLQGPPEHIYVKSAIAQRAAFLYVLTEDERYAKLARDMIEKVIGDQKYWKNGGAFGLRLYWIGARTSLVYDWCYNSKAWDDAFCQHVSKELIAHGTAILKRGGKSQNQSPASNWQGGRWSSGGLCLLASDDSYDAKMLNQAEQRTRRYLTENLGGGKESRGWNIEGLGYTYFPMGNYVHPFAVALLRHDPKKDLRATCAGARWTLWTCFAATTLTKSLGRIRPDFGDDNPGTGLEGTGGQAFWWCPEELHPGLVHVYDKVWGENGDQTYDNTRCGTIYSILYHPGEAVKPVDPMQIAKWREGFVDTGGNGYQTYRNRYQDGNDSIAQMYIKLRGNKGHSGPDALSFRIIGLDSGLAVGGGRYGKGNVFWQSMNTVYPGKPEQVSKPSGQSGKLVGKPVSFEDGSGHCISEIAQNNVHTQGHKRWFVAGHGKAGTEAAYVIVDKTANGKVWQLCTYSGNTVKVSGKTFTITAPTGSMQGTVLYPPDAKLASGSRKRGSNYMTSDTNNWITAEGAGGDFVVVLTTVLDGGTHPEVSATGTWGDDPQGTVSVGDWQVGIAADAVTYP